MMETNSAKGRVIICGSLLAVIFILIALLLRNGTKSLSIPTRASTSNSDGADLAAAPRSPGIDATLPASDTTAVTFILGEDSAAPPVTAPPIPAVEPSQWEERIKELLTNGDINTKDAIRELFAMAKDRRGTTTLRVEAVEHGLNLLDDADYFAFAIDLNTDTGLPQEIHDTLFADLQNRTHSVSSSVVEQIAQTQGHPLATEAKNFIDFVNEIQKEEPTSEQSMQATAK